MSGYQLLNGTHVSANSEALNGHLKTELGFQGAVMSDWGGVWDGANTFNAGNDLDFPGLNLFGLLGSFFADDLPGDFANGTVSEARLTDAAVRILTPYFQLGQADK
jgi:beta-glucosidase